MAVARRPKQNPFLSLLSQVSAELEPRLSQVLAASEAQAESYGSEVGAMVGAVRGLCERGGKRLRPGLCVVGAMSVESRASREVAIEAGVALELLQAYFLIHDDWMDQDEERRGGPTAHVALGRLFGSKELGACSAILAGDHAVALASAHLTTLAIPASRLKKCMHRFAEMQLAAVAGQQLDVLGKTANPELTYELKTSSYTVRGPLLLGAEIAGASKATLASLEAFSSPLGVAVQLRDDLIGVFGETKVTGKPQGGDLKEGKNTSLVHEAARRLSARERAQFQRVLGNRMATTRQVQSAIALLERCGAKAAVEERITLLKGEAQGVLSRSALPSRVRTLLKGAIVALADRRA